MSEFAFSNHNVLLLGAIILALATIILNVIFLIEERNPFVTPINNPRRYRISRLLWRRWLRRIIRQSRRWKFLAFVDVTAAVIFAMLIAGSFLQKPQVESNAVLLKIFEKLSAIEDMHRSPPIVDKKGGTENTREISVSLPFNWTMSLILIIAAFLVFPFVVMVIFVGLRRRDPNIAIGAGAVAVVGELGMLFTLAPKLDKILEFHFSPHIEFPFKGGESPEPKVDQIIEIRLPKNRVAQTTLDCGTRANNSNTFRVWPFPVGLAAIEDTRGLPSQDIKSEFSRLEGQVASIGAALSEDVTNNENSRRRVVAVLIIGSADRRDIKGDSRLFSSNAGLAQARAQWVRSRLENVRGLKTATIVALNAGPTHPRIMHGDDAQKLALDRAVQVCAIWESGDL